MSVKDCLFKKLLHSWQQFFPVIVTVFDLTNIRFFVKLSFSFVTQQLFKTHDCRKPNN
jgi:hypothetical protein